MESKHASYYEVVRKDVAAWRLYKASESHAQVERIISRALEEGWPEQTIANLHEVEQQALTERSRLSEEFRKLAV